MKRLSFLFTVGSIAVVSLLSSCGDKKDDPIPAPTVSAAFVGVTGSNAVALTGTVVKINYSATAGEGLQSITATAKYGATTVNVWSAKTSGFKSSTSDDATVDFTSPSSGEVVITVTVTDKKSQTSTATLTLNKAVALTESTGGIYFNTKGSGLSGYNFDTKANVSSADAGADIVSAEAEANVNPFLGTFKTANGATMVKSDGTTYTSATSMSLATAYGAGTIAEQVNPIVGDVYIIKFSSTMFVAIKISAINSDGVGTVALPKNQDNVTFVYKK